MSKPAANDQPSVLKGWSILVAREYFMGLY